MKRFTPLDSSIRLHTAALNRLPVCIYLFGERMAEGVIEAIDDEYITLMETSGKRSYFFRKDCTIYTN